MKPNNPIRFFRIFLALLCCGVFCAYGAEPKNPAAAAAALIQRVTPSIADRFRLEVIPADNGKDVFEVEQSGDKIILRGNNGVSLASAFNYYLQKYCQCEHSLWGDQMNLPDPLPKVTEKHRAVSPRRIRHFFNYCTFNYSGSWWTPEHWERVVDFLAMNGINMPLNIIGVESAWYHTLLRMGFTELEARSYIAAPVYLNWQWMGNLEGTGGPPPLNWITQREELGRKIMEREQALGMTPILHGFAGVVPRLFMKKFPGSNIQLKPEWGRGAFLGVAQLDPLDPLFPKVHKIYLEELINRFGTSHLYMIDPFHESAPPVDGDEYQQKVARSIDQTLLEVDPKAVWLSQDWSFRPAIIKSIPKDRMIIMSLKGDKIDRYQDWGYRFTIGQLNSFGGESHMHGNIKEAVSSRIADTIARNPNCVGSGNWMESLENAPAYYHAELEMNWEKGALDPQQWFDDYAKRRYGGFSDNIHQANKLLLTSAYTRGGRGFGSILTSRPMIFSARVDTANFQTHVAALKALLADGEKFRNSPGYRYDVVDLTRQVLSHYAVFCQRDIAIYLNRGDLNSFRKARARFLEIFDDMEELTGSCENFLFGKWIADARSWGKTKEESDYYAFYAATLITLWGHDTLNGQPKDYAWREWNGLIGGFYKVRWTMFLDEVERRLVKGEIFQDVYRSKEDRPLTLADKSGLYARMYEFEEGFRRNLPELKSRPQGDSYEIAARIWRKNGPDFLLLNGKVPAHKITMELTREEGAELLKFGIDRARKPDPKVVKAALSEPPFFKY